jgi:UDP-glucose 4-epimerase
LPKRVLISGASGFIGANLVRRVLADGHEAHVVLRPEYQGWRLRDVLGDLRCHAVDLQDREGIAAVVRELRPEWVFHLAAYGAYSNQLGFEQMVATNLLGCAALLDASADAGCEAFINAGSSSEYGLKDHAATEDEVLRPNSHYAIAKAAASHYCGFTARSRGVNAITVRLYSAYGPYEEPGRLIPTLLVHALEGTLPPLVGPGTARDFIYVDDAVDAMMRLAGAAGVPRGSVYNVCTGKQTTLAEIVETVRRMLGVAVSPVWGTMPQRSWDTDVWVGSPAALCARVGWQAPTALSEGLRRTAAWLNENSERLKFYSARAPRK